MRNNSPVSQLTAVPHTVSFVAVIIGVTVGLRDRRASNSRLYVYIGQPYAIINCFAPWKETSRRGIPVLECPPIPATHQQERSGATLKLGTVTSAGFLPVFGGDLLSELVRAWFIDLNMVVLFFILIPYLLVGVLDLAERLLELLTRSMGVPLEGDGGER